MRTPLAPKPGQTAFRELLIEREKAGSLVRIQDVVAATGWKTSTVRTYVSKMLRSHLHLAERGAYHVTGIGDLDEQDFLRLLSQSARRREAPMKLRDPLARALAAKAKENMLLALELYNRPTLANRLDSFTQIFCTAWEQLMKAELQERAPGSIFRPKKTKNRRKETIGFQECLGLFQELDPVRHNLQEIQELRDESTHLLMRELQPLASRLFQSGVLNFARRYLEVSGNPLMPEEAVGLLSLILKPPPLDPIELEAAYGKATARDILVKAQEMEARILQGTSLDFAIPLRFEVVITKSPSPGDLRITITGEDDEPDTAAMIIEKPVDLQRKYPHRAKDLARLLSESSGKDFSIHAILAFIDHEKFKNSNNEFHYFFSVTRTRLYSEKALIFLKSRIQDDPGYADRCLESYNRRRARTPKN